MSFLKKFSNHLVAPKATVNLQLNDQFAVLGDNLEGTLTVTAHETIDAEEIRCELNCTETVQVSRTEYDPTLKRPVTRQFTENRVLYQANAVCNPATQLVPEVTKKLQVQRQSFLRVRAQLSCPLSITSNGKSRELSQFTEDPTLQQRPCSST